MIFLALGCVLESPVGAMVLFPGPVRNRWLAMRLVASLCLFRAGLELLS